MKNEIAVFGGGCFWCTEAIFQELRGVISVLPGYAGGDTHSPSYDQVTSGDTGHAEVIRIEFDSSVIPYSDLFEIFMNTHDPTSLNRQGNDVGPQYRSIVLYTTEEQRKVSEQYISEAKKEGISIVTEVVALDEFFEAEKYHHNYYRKNKDQGYCQVVISPKLQKLRKRYKRFLKEEATA